MTALYLSTSSCGLSPSSSARTRIGVPCSSVPETMRTSCPAIRMYLLKTSEGTPKPATWPMWRGPLVYGQATADRTWLMASNPRRGGGATPHEDAPRARRRVRRRVRRGRTVGFLLAPEVLLRVRQRHDWTHRTGRGHRRRVAACRLGRPDGAGAGEAVDGRYHSHHRLAGRRPHHLAGRDGGQALRGQGRGARGRGGPPSLDDALQPAHGPGGPARELPHRHLHADPDEGRPHHVGPRAGRERLAGAGRPVLAELAGHARVA